METPNCWSSKYKDVEDCLQSVKEAPDFVIEVDNVQIPCHKSTLRKASSYFEALFSSRMRESEQSHVTLEDTEKCTFMTLLKFAYVGQLDICEETMFPIAAMSNMYQFESAQKKAEKFLASRVTPKTWSSILQFSDTHQLKETFYVAIRYILWYFPQEINRTMDGFCTLSKNLLCKVLGNPLLNCDSEKHILKALKSWSVSHGISFSSQEFTELLSSVICMSDLDSEDIRSIGLENAPQSLIKKQKGERSLDAIDISEESGRSTWSRIGPLAMLCVGGDIIKDTGPSPSKCIYKVDPSTGDIQAFASLEQVFPTQGTNMGYRACCVDSDLYITGGEAYLGRNTWQTDVWKFSSFTNSWTSVTTLLQPRRHHGICVLQDEIYLLGGIGKFRQVLTSVEKYNPATDEWTELAGLLHSEFWPAAVACQGDIYVMKNYIQKYSAARDQWTKLTVELPVNLGYYSAVCVQDVIYMKCQYDGTLMKLQTNLKQKVHVTAETVAEFSEAPSGQLLYFRGKIFCLTVDCCLKSQYFDFQTQKVVTIGSPDVQLSGFSVVLLPSFPSQL